MVEHHVYFHRTFNDYFRRLTPTTWGRHANFGLRWGGSNRYVVNRDSTPHITILYRTFQWRCCLDFTHFKGQQQIILGLNYFLPAINRGLTSFWWVLLDSGRTQFENTVPIPIMVVRNRNRKNVTTIEFHKVKSAGQFYYLVTMIPRMYLESWPF